MILFARSCLGLAALAIVSCSGGSSDTPPQPLASPPTQAAQGDEAEGVEARTRRERDVDVIAVTLEHFTARADTLPYHKDGITLIEEQTSKWASGFDRSNAKCEVPQALYDRLVTRNDAELPAAPLVRMSKAWRFIRPGDLKDPIFVDRTAAGEPIRTIARLHTPAYSDSADAALVVLHFRWSIHGAIAHYLLKPSGNGWQVQCSDLFFYV